jgi:hypothetical protein
MTLGSVGERREKLGLFRFSEIVEHRTLGRRPRAGTAKLLVGWKLSMSPSRWFNRLCRYLESQVYEPRQVIRLRCASGEVLSERVAQEARQRDGTMLIGLGLAEDQALTIDLGHRLRHKHASTEKINSTDAQCAHLASSQRGGWSDELSMS